MSRELDVDPVLQHVTGLLRELADPTRFTVLQLLALEGPHAMSEIADTLDVPAPRLGNHLARLREANLVTVERSGRHAVYRLARPGIGQLLDQVVEVSSHAGARYRPSTPPSPLATAHTCYRHIAGRLGVNLFDDAVRRGAIMPPDGTRTELDLGPRADDYFAEIDVDVAAVRRSRRKLATACLDWTARRPHLGGALGDAVLDSFVEAGLLEREPDNRVLVPTAQGSKRLAAFL